VKLWKRITHMSENTRIKQVEAHVRAITRGPRQHYFGYYDKRQFDSSGRFALGLVCDIIGRRQETADIAEVGLVDLENDDAWIPLGQTRAWNWQFGCLAQWFPGKSGNIIYNDCRDGCFVSVVLDTRTREERVLRQPVFDINPDGRTALTVNFARLSRLRPETGFRGVNDPAEADPAPADDGIFRFDLATEKRELLFSLREIADRDPHPDMNGAEHYITHPLWNNNGSRFLFWHRWKAGVHKSARSRLYTANADGTDLYLMHDDHSHTTWHGRDKVLAWARTEDEGNHYYLFTDRSGSREIVGNGVLTENGHFTFSPDAKWLLTDTPPDKNHERAVLLYHWESGQCFNVGRFFSPPGMAEYRCDPHPRWHSDGRMVCIDSVHDGSRQMYLIDVVLGSNQKIKDKT